MRKLYEAMLGEKNYIYYLTKFELFDQQGPGLKASWNWPAFFFPVWALYRKLYGWFFAIFCIMFLSNILYKEGSPLLSVIVFIAPWIAFTIYANSLYHNNIKKKIAFAQLTVQDETKLLEYLRYKGGVHTWVIYVVSCVPILGIVAAIAIPSFGKQTATVQFIGVVFLILIVECFCAYAAYFIIRKIFQVQALKVLAVAVSLLGLIIGWTAAYRVAKDSEVQAHYNSVNNHYKQVRGSEMSGDEWSSVYSSYINNNQRCPVK